MLTDYRLLGSLLNAGYFVLIQGLGLMNFGLLLAVAINRPYREMGVFRALFYLPAVLSVSVISTIWVRVYRPGNGLLANFFNVLQLKPIAWLLDVNLAKPASERSPFAYS
jgi:ABC-type sugar transport system permease subunit